ncbi:MAG: hypothetical protein O7F73_02805, partial [Gammaproteobacteria bacterium]|nr:hypothetical protein [Gammaproteobacteria bacterium]
GLLIAGQEGSSNPFLSELRGSKCVMERSISLIDPAPAKIGCIYQSVSPRAVDLGFSGRFNPGHRVHQAIDELQSGDSVTLSQNEGRWYLLDDQGREVSRMAKDYVPPPGKRFDHGRVAAILRRSKDQTDPDWTHTIKIDEWEVVVPELVFSPD